MDYRIFLWAYIFSIFLRKIIDILRKPADDFRDLKKEIKVGRIGYNVDTIPAVSVKRDTPMRERFKYEVDRLCISGVGMVSDYAHEIALFRKLMKGRKCNISFYFTDDEKSIILYEGVYPENLVKIEIENNTYKVMEVRRNDKIVRRKTEDVDLAVFFATALQGDLGLDCSDSERDFDNKEKMQQFVKAGNRKEAQDILRNEFGDSLLSIDTEDRDKISLLEIEGMGDVMFSGKKIIKDRTPEVAYAVAYNYCNKLKRADKLYDKICEIAGRDIGRRENIRRLYVLRK
ncbi:MAG: hypothetical protein J1E62_02030 [Lachnospiraceae bacterium]|nr:hypothetical protein [Lachnospiraceae bacterium]